MRTAQDAITDVEFEEAFEASLKAVDEIVDKDHPEQLLSVLQVITRQGFGEKLGQIVVAMPDLPENSTERQGAFEAIGAKCMREYDKYGAPVAIVFTTEAWTTGKPLDQAGYDKFKKSGQKVSDTKDKKEIVLTAARTIDRRRAYAIHDIQRDSKKHIKKLDLALYAPYKGKVNAKLFDSALLDSFYKGAYDEAQKGKS